MLIPNTLIHDRYLVEQRLGGSVYQALDLTTRAPVALKPLGALPPGTSAEQAAGVLPVLRHPHLPAVRGSFAEAGQAFLVLDLVPGHDLATLLAQDGPPPIEQGRRWARQLLDALDYVHTLDPPLAHGAIEPASIRLDARGEPVLLGLRPHAAPAAAPTPYTAPEQQAGAAASPRGDLYALAATLYHLLVGQPPTAPAERQRALAEGRPDPLPAPRALNIRVPAALSNALRQALTLAPAQRPESAAALLAAIDDFPQPPPSPPPPRRLPVPPLVIVGALVALLVAVFLLRPTGPAPAAPTAAPAATSSPAAAGQPTTAPSAPSAATARPVAPTAARQPTAAPATAAPGFRVTNIQPAELFAGTRPLTLTVQGSNLGLVTNARLVSSDLPALTATITSSGPDALVLDIVPPATLPDGEAAYQLELDGAVVETPPVVLRDFYDRVIVKGVLPQYGYTGRVAADAQGAFTALRAEATATSARVGQLRNGDGLDILDISIEGWYRVRIRTSGESALVGTVGWIERWLVEDKDVPGAPTLLVFVGRLGTTPTDAAVQCGTAFDSSIYGSVENARGVGITGARLRVTSADGRNSYTVTTGRGGVYTVPGLGCTTWRISLLSVPNTPNGIQANSITVRNLNGGKFTAAEVRFKQQP